MHVYYLSDFAYPAVLQLLQVLLEFALLSIEALYDSNIDFLLFFVLASNLLSVQERSWTIHKSSIA